MPRRKYGIEGFSSSESSPELEKTPKMPKMQKTPKKDESENPSMDIENDILMQGIQTMFAKQTEEIRASEERVKDTVALKIQELERKIEDIQEENLELKTRQAAMEGRVLMLERESRKFNIVATGLMTEPGQDGAQLLQAMIRDATGSDMTLKNNRTFVANGRMKCVATCNSWEEKMLIMSNKKKLKNKGSGEPIYIDNDMPKEDREAQGKLRAIAREKRAEAKDVRLGFRKMKIDGEWISLETAINEQPFRPENRANCHMERTRTEMQDKGHKQLPK